MPTPATRRLSTRRAFVGLLGALPAARVGMAPAWDQVEEAGRDDAADLPKAMRRLAEGTRLFVVAEGQPKQPAALRPEALFRYNAPDGGLKDATLWGWGHSGRLTATLKVEYWTNPPGARWGIGVASFATAPLEIAFSDGVIQTLDQPGWEPQPILAPAPAGPARQRLVQMKSLARRFTLTVHSHRERNPIQLRLLATPIDRYKDPDAGIQDGTVFGFSSGTNPTVLLAMEAMQQPEGKGSWRFGLARQGVSEIHALLDGKEVWTQPFGWGPPATRVYTNRTLAVE